MKNGISELNIRDKMPESNECEHGQLKRSCSFCEYEEELRELERRLKKLRDGQVVATLNTIDRMKSALRKIESLSFDRVELGENFTREMAQDTDYILTEVGEIAHNTLEKEYGTSHKALED